MNIFAVDKAILVPINRFESKFPVKVHGDRTFHSYVPPQLAEDVRAFIAEYAPLVAAEERREDVQRQIDRQLQLQQETWALSAEMSLQIQVDTVRHLALRDDLQPRMGATLDENYINLQNMSERLVSNAAKLKKAGAVIRLLDRHTHANVQKQLAIHKGADNEILRLKGLLGGEQTKLEQLRLRGAKLQSSINAFLRGFFDGDRAKQVEFGLAERTRERPAKTDDETDSKTDSKTDEKADAKGGDAKTKTDEKPATPGPIASGTSSEAVTAKSDAAGAVPAGDDAKPKQAEK